MSLFKVLISATTWFLLFEVWLDWERLFNDGVVDVLKVFGAVADEAVDMVTELGEALPDVFDLQDNNLLQQGDELL